MKFEFLADRPDALAVVAAWYYDEWGRTNPDLSAERITQKLSLSMNTNKVPLIVLAIDQDAVVGAVELKYREMNMYPDKDYWLGGLYVAPECRGLGVGKQLVEQVVHIASGFGLKKLHLQTEQLDGGIYARLGWTAYEKVCNKGINVLVMDKQLSD